MLTDYQREFLHPDSEFSPIPFWFWNDILDKGEIDRQICEFKKKGVDGFVIHPRIGLPKKIEYLSDEFMDYVKFAVERAKELHMKVVLYDEAMYPSGSAHGQVVQYNPKFASKGLKMVSKYIPDEDDVLVAIIDVNTETDERVEAVGELLEGFERFYFVMTNSEGTIRGIHFGEDDGQPNAPKSADLLNPEAVKCFINLTHERYYECLSDYFGNTIIAMFTDEPMILGRRHRKGLIEWTDNFLSYYIENGGKVTDLPLLFERDNGDCKEKKHYKKVVKQLLSQSFYNQIAIWCRTHNIKLTGHPESSEDIGLLKYFDIPCQDIVWRFVEPEGQKGIIGKHSTMAKCSSDSARHHNKLRNGNECFGCCGAKDDPFLFTREDMKWYLDWLFVRGVNMIYPHAFFYSIRDARKDERPPDVGMNSGFWDEYKEITDYIKRMSQLLTGSVNITDVAILCTQDKLPWEIAKPLFENQIEFNYLEEELLSNCQIDNGYISIAQQKYHVIIVEDEYSRETQAYLKQFKECGGIIIDGDFKDLVNNVRKHAVQDMYIMPAHEDLRKTHIRKEKTEFILLTNEGEQMISTELHLNYGYVNEIWDAEKGMIEKLLEPTEKVTLKLERRKSLILVVNSIN